MTADHATDRTADQAADRSPDHQKTIREPVSFTGVGLHTGTTTTITFRPAPPGSGIRFVRTDLPGRPEIQVRPENARHDTRQLRRTIIAHGAAEVHTVEHVLSTVAGLGLDNLILEVDGMEAPEAVDGSARSLVALVRSAGVVDQGVPRDYLVLREPVSFQDDGIQILGIPHDGLRISFTIQYENPLVGTQYRSIEITPEVYAREIAPARTFALFEEVAMLREAGMIKGGTLENAVVVQGDRILNEDGLRFPDEFVRHKILDLLGDLTLLGKPLRGHVLSVRSGHDSHIAFVQQVHEQMGRANGRVESRGYADYLDRIHFDIAAIERIMPHRYPFLLVDRILFLEERKRVIGLKNVTINEHYFVGHFPGHPIMPAVLILEAMAQVGGILLLNTVEHPESKLVYFIGIDNAKFRRPVLPGDQLIFDLELVRLKSRICRMNGKGYVRGALVAEAELTSTIVDR